MRNLLRAALAAVCFLVVFVAIQFPWSPRYCPYAPYEWAYPEGCWVYRDGVISPFENRDK